MDKKKKKLFYKIFSVIILIIILLILLVWTGNIRCSKIPGMCSIYWGTQSLISGKQQPSIMIIHDPFQKEGMGNPYLLQKYLKEGTNSRINSTLENINYISQDKLKGVSLIIVDKAKKISTNQLEMFIDYISKGGRLIWIGDSGTEKDINDKFLTKGDLEASFDKNIINPWARLNSENYMIRFDDILGVEYISNYCDIKKCSKKTYEIIQGQKTEYFSPEQYNGNLIPTKNHPLTYALNDYLKIKDDFSIVTVKGSKIIPLKLDYGSNIYANSTQEIGDQSIFPLIVVSNSNRVAYYSIPPEYFVENEDKEKYTSIIENIIDGMLK
ncbi:MAG: hypothetical protein PHR26_04030 [Candidatus ainarchaeum sp.]|nr:hypothetical protein [Candidatus ainarchaeum sp.]MDD3975617.1 hypothetical protein [Candidatus ainarchaeum sp.]